MSESSSLAHPRETSRTDDRPSVTELRAALADAILDRAWRVVEIIQGQIDAAERAELPDNVRRLVPKGVVDPR